MKKIVVVIPTYNEADNIKNISKALFALDIVGLEILFVDDNSPDGTGQVADDLSVKFPGKISVMHRSGKLGLGTAYIQGFKWAIENQADIVIQMDADFSHSPEYVPQLVALIDYNDVVVGSRYISGGQVDKNWSWGRWFLSWWANSIWVRLILGVKTKDSTAGFKCWRSDALERIGLDQIRSNGYVFQVEMCYVSEMKGLRIKEIPIYFEDRRIGLSKMSMRVKIEAALRVFEIRKRYRNRRVSSF